VRCASFAARLPIIAWPTFGQHSNASARLAYARAAVAARLAFARGRATGLDARAGLAYRRAAVTARLAVVGGCALDLDARARLAGMLAAVSTRLAVVACPHSTAAGKQAPSTHTTLSPQGVPLSTLAPAMQTRVLSLHVDASLQSEDVWLQLREGSVDTQANRQLFVQPPSRSEPPDRIPPGPPRCRLHNQIQGEASCRCIPRSFRSRRPRLGRPAICRRVLGSCCLASSKPPVSSTPPPPGTTRGAGLAAVALTGLEGAASQYHARPPTTAAAQPQSRCWTNARATCPDRAPRIAIAIIAADRLALGDGRVADPQPATTPTAPTPAITRGATREGGWSCAPVDSR